MKSLLLFVVLLCCYSSFAQNDRGCVTKRQMDSLHAAIMANRPHLVSQGKLPADPLNIGWSHAFRWPMVAAGNNYQPNFYYNSNFVDLDPATNSNDDHDTSVIEDYHCGNRTYDGHSGTDIAIGPFGWTMMDNNNVYVVAAEQGTIVAKHQGELSRTCKRGVVINNYGNYIAVELSDGLITYYMHMKNGTLTNKDTGDVVNVGEYLGVVASSGNSTGPHLHFEVRSPYSEIDPFFNGACHDDHAGLVTSSFWADEEPYMNPKILSVFTLSAPWTEPQCDETGYSNGISGVVPYCNHFASNSTVFFSASVRDMSTPTTVRLRIYNPSGTELYDNTFDITYYDKEHTIPVQVFFPGSTQGTYKLLCTYNGVSEPHFFTVGCPPSQTLSGTVSSNTGVISGGSINSTETVSSTAVNVEYQAETYIQFNPGFHAVAGCDLLARIDACTAGGQKMTKEEKKKQ